MAAATVGELSKKERDLAISYLVETKQVLVKTVKPLTDEQLNFKVHQEAWSIAECIEHLALSEDLIFQWSQDAIDKSAEKGDIAFEDSILIKIFIDRSQKSATLSVLEPHGTYKTTGAALDSFNEKRNRHIQYVRQTSDPLRSNYFDFPFGKGDAYQVILLLAAHTERHTKQILEVMSNPNFPKSK